MGCCRFRVWKGFSAVLRSQQPAGASDAMILWCDGGLAAKWWTDGGMSRCTVDAV